MNVAEVLQRKNRDGSLRVVRSSCSGESRSKEDIHDNMLKLSSFLQGAGIGPGSIVLVLTGNAIHTVEILLAVMNVGAIAVPYSPLAGNRLMEEVAAQVRPSAVFYDATLPEGLCSNLRDTCRVFVKAEGVGMPATHVSYADALAASARRAVAGDFAPDTPALLIHTSGSQGRQKVIKMSHRNLENFFRYHDLVYQQFFDEALPSAPVISVFPFHHLAGIATCFQGLLMGRPTLLLKHFESKLFLATLAKERVTFFAMVASIYSRLLNEEALLCSLDLSCLEACCAVGEPCPESLLEKIGSKLGVRPLVGYGLTECLPGIAHARRDILAGSIPNGSCGKLLFGEIKLIDESGREDPLEGRLCVRNPTVHACYQDEDLNAQVLEDGWYQTQDLFRRDAQGNFFHRGRLDDMFHVSGKNIYPIELETVLLSHPSVRQACVVPVLVDGCTASGAVISVRGELKRMAVFDFLTANAPSHIIPRRLEMVSEIPSLGPGKADRRACIEILQAAR